MTLKIRIDTASRVKNPKNYSYKCEFSNAVELISAKNKLANFPCLIVEQKTAFELHVTINKDNLVTFNRMHLDFDYKQHKSPSHYRASIQAALYQIINGKEKTSNGANLIKRKSAESITSERPELLVTVKIKSDDEKQVLAIRENIEQVFGFETKVSEHIIDKKKYYIAKGQGRLTKELVDKAQIDITDNAVGRARKLRAVINASAIDNEKIAVSSTKLVVKNVEAKAIKKPIILVPSTAKIKALKDKAVTRLPAVNLEEFIEKRKTQIRRSLLDTIKDTALRLPSEKICCTRLMFTQTDENKGETYLICMGGGLESINSFRKWLVDELGETEIRQGTAWRLDHASFRIGDDLASSIKLSLDAAKLSAYGKMRGGLGFREFVDKSGVNDIKPLPSAFESINGDAGFAKFAKLVSAAFRDPYTQTINPALKIKAKNGYHEIEVPKTFIGDILSNKVILELFGFNRKQRTRTEFRHLAR